MKNIFFIVQAVFTFALFALSGNTVFAAGTTQDTMVVSRIEGQPLLGNYLLMTGSDHQLNINTVVHLLPKTSFYQIDPNFGFSDKLHVKRHYWLKLLVRNEAPVDTVVYLQFHSQVIDIATGYQEQSKGQFVNFGKTGTDLDFFKRILPSYDIVFPINLRVGESKNLVIQIDSNDGDEIHLLPELTSAKNYKAAEERYYMITGIITGLMLIVFIFNLILWSWIRERIHILYAVYVFVALYEIYSMIGADIQFLYPHSPSLSGDLQDVSPCILGILMTLIMQEFLNHKTKYSVFKLPARIGLWLILGMMLLCFITGKFFEEARFLNGLEEMILAGLLFAQCILFILCASERIIQGYKPAYFYLGAILIFDAGLIQFIWMVIFGSNQDAVLNSYPNLIEIGITIETIIVFIGIVYRYARARGNLLTEIVAAGQAERARLSGDLHDDVGGTLGTLTNHLKSASQEMSKEELENFLKISTKLADKAYDTVRDLSHNLIPTTFKKDGLFLSIEERIRMLNANKNIKFYFTSNGNDAGIPQDVAFTIYLIFSEIVTNIFKHSIASEAYFKLFINEKDIELFAEDNGIGFEADRKFKNGIGLRNINSRVTLLKGNILIDSNSNGTHITIQIPYSHARKKRKN